MSISSNSSFDEGYFQTKDHLKLSYWIHRAPEPKGTLVLLHGHGEHSGRYRKFADHLKDFSLNIAAYDFRGHGKSEGPHVYVENYDLFLSDVTAFIETLKTQGLWKEPFILLGHSNGGLTAVRWLQTQSQHPKGLILSSPFLGLRLPGFLKGLNSFFDTFMPGFVYKNPVYPPYLTHNTDELEAYKKDPYIRRKISVRLLAQMLFSIAKVHEAPQLAFSFPCYILASGEEKVVDLDQTRRFFDRLEAPKKDLQIFPGLYHEIFNEKGQDEVFAKLREYLSSILS